MSCCLHFKFVRNIDILSSKNIEYYSLNIGNKTEQPNGLAKSLDLVFF